MKRRRPLVFLGPVTAILFCAVLVSHWAGSVPRARVEGEQLSLVSLAPNEQIVVSTVFAHRTSTAREYHFRIEHSRLDVIVFDAAITRDGEFSSTVPIKILAMRELTSREVEGLDETIRYFREVREEESSATRHTRLAYFRDAKKIGEEFFIGFSLPANLAYQIIEAARSAPGDKYDYHHSLAATYNVSEVRLRKMMPFEMLEPQPSPESETRSDR